MGEQGGLSVAGQAQLLFRSFLAKLDQVIAQKVVGLLVAPLSGRKIPDQVAAHPDVLGTLSRKDEHDLLVLARHDLSLIHI